MFRTSDPLKYCVMWVMFCVMFLVLLSFTASFARTYYNQKAHRLERFEYVKKFHTENCDVNKSILEEVQHLCHDYQHEMMEEPGLYAFFDTLEEMHLCWGDRCQDSLFSKLVSPFQTLAWIFFFALITAFLMWYYCFTKWNDAVKRPELPFSFESARKKVQ